MASVLLVLATVTTGLYVGLFFAFRFVFMPALGQGSDDEFTAVMRRINRVIVNPWFLALFLGVILWPLLAVFLADDRLLAGLGLAANVVSHGITIGGNIPLNGALDRAPLDTPEQRLAAREAFEVRWNRLHTARTVVGVAGFALLTCATLAQ
ncbi:hypothetical protein SRB5_64700 [Streptomyces sp. RB5]|uniref:DUF1772 domain-containing protein n=1 Tax=Streptomyces smaragdinus TaxID=2585196 RepID=A0A7K0CTE2_9ACTN|nr:anthrone oxygenase family protein [Streptomyces smaragdinus]MQY16272.1 hypothetical protein [Streptomyces smaragdinus]